MSRARRPGEIGITLLLRQAGAEEIEARLAGLAAKLPAERERLSRAALERLVGLAPADWARTEEFARWAGLRVVGADRICGSVTLAGSPAALERAFRVKLALYREEQGSYWSHAGAVHLPAELAGSVEAVLGLDARPLARRHAVPPRRRSPAPVHPAEIAKIYQFPEDAAGRGQSIVLVELGGGFYAADLREYFSRLGLRAPAVAVRRIDGARNAPAGQAEIRRFWESVTEANGGAGRAPAGGLSHEQLERIGWTIEATMDLQLAAALAPGARFAVFFAPPTAHGKFQAIRAALRQSRSGPVIVSMSWGAHEDGFGAPAVAAIERLLKLAALRHITVCCSSGDDGDGADAGGAPRVNYPASSPHALACGGTHLAPAGTRESVWQEEFGGRAMASGGRASRLFPQPDWQAGAQVGHKTGAQGRGVPDVAAKADVAGGYRILAAGLELAMGGTSAAAPLWAALIARLNEKLGAPVGYLTPLLYRSRFHSAFRDITRGASGRRYRASRGWDPCTGWGSPKGPQLLEALRKG